MKHLVIILLLFFSSACFSQESEFQVSKNGLIYSDTTIKQLKFIVDSLNLKFRICDLNKIYMSKLQAKAHFISLDENVKQAKKDIEANISYDEFLKKYPKAKLEKELLVVKYKFKNYKDKDVVEFSSIGFNDKFEHEFDFEEDLNDYDKPLKNKWIYEYYSKSEYSNEIIKAFYFISDFSQQALPEEYAKMIQYSDCMIDTSAQIFKSNSYPQDDEEEPKNIKKFMEYVHKETNRPEYNDDFDEKEYEIYWGKYKVWDSLRLVRIDSIRSKEEKFNILLKEATKDAISKGGSNDEFEEYVGLYYSKKTALELKRNRRVMGMCSQDDRPRIHALNIAKLSAETINWEIFLRAHLDIMNDRFERMSDGSYAWGARKTYIKELELLDINVLDLLLGISLRIENPSMNHYYGSISRLGRALSETKNSNEIESKMLKMISDDQLDDFNRILTYYLFLNYNYYIENKEEQEENKIKLMEAVKTLPEYLSSKILSEK